MSNFNFLYDTYYAAMTELLNRTGDRYDREFRERYYNFMRSADGARKFVDGVEARLNRMGIRDQTTVRDVAEACMWILDDAYNNYRASRQPSRSFADDGRVGFQGSSGSGYNPPTQSSGSSILDPDFPSAPSTSPQSAPDIYSGSSAPSQPVRHSSSDKSPFAGVTSKDLDEKGVAAFDMAVFDRNQITHSNFSEIECATGFTFGAAPQINLVKVESRTPISNPNSLDEALRRVFTPDLIGLYWGISVSYKRIYTLPIPLEEYTRLCADIVARTGEEGYTPELIISVLKTCTQATYEAVSAYLVTEFNKLSTRFIRTTAAPNAKITLSNLDGIPAFLKSPPKGTLTENPNSVAQFASITNSFFRKLFSTSVKPSNSESLTLESYPTYLHNDSVDMWDPKLEISKFGIPLKAEADQRDWLARVNRRMTFLTRDEKVFVTNIMPPEFMSSTRIGQVIDPTSSGDVRVLHSLLRMVDYTRDTNVSGVIAAPLNRHGTAVLGNYSLINPLEDEKKVFLERRGEI